MKNLAVLVKIKDIFLKFISQIINKDMLNLKYRNSEENKFMDREKTLEILKEAFSHFIIEEDVQLDGIFAYLYIPSIKTIMVNEETNTDDYLEIVVKEEQNEVGKIINDILLSKEFMPMLEE